MVIYDKYFVIGFNKSEDYTIHKLFIENGIPSQHWNHNKPWDTDDYMAFSNGTDYNDFKLLEKKYPNALFILNTRNLDDWLISRFKHHDNDKLIWGYPPTPMKCSKWIYSREKYYLDILKDFEKMPDKLILLSVSEDSWIDYLSSVLNLVVTNIEPEYIEPTDITNPSHSNILNIVDKTLNLLNYIDRKNILVKNPSLNKKYLSLYRNNILVKDFMNYQLIRESINTLTSEDKTLLINDLISKLERTEILLNIKNDIIEKKFMILLESVNV